MSEFGNETATAALKLTTKSLEELLQLLKYLMERNERKIESDLKKEKVKTMKVDAEIKKNDVEIKRARQYLNKAKGNIRANMLYKSGEKLLPISIPLSVNELRTFEKYSKIYGLAYASISDKRVAENIKKIKKEIKITDDESTKEGLKKQLKELEKERQKRIIIIREKDLEITKDITDRMNLDLKLKDINNEIDHAIENGDSEAIKSLEKEKEEINQSVFEKFNSLSNKIAIAETTGEDIEKKIDFNKAISGITDLQELNKSTILCERTNPNNFIEAVSREEISNDGRKFINTEFKVFNNNVEQKCDEFKHGKFTHYSDRKGDNTSEIGDKHWINMKKEIEQKGNFSNDLLMFENKEAYERYKKEFTKFEEKVAKREDVISYEADSNSYKDCLGIINNLKAQLSDHDMALNAQRELCKKESKEVIQFNKNMTDDEKIQFAESVNIAKQISNYENINDLQNKIELKKLEQREDKQKYSEVESNSEALELYKKSQEKFTEELRELQEKLDTCNKKAEELEIQQKKIESVAIIGIIESEKTLVEETLENVDDITIKDNVILTEKTKEEWENDINVNSQNKVGTQTQTNTQTKTINSERSIE